MNFVNLNQRISALLWFPLVLIIYVALILVTLTCKAETEISQRLSVNGSQRSAFTNEFGYRWMMSSNHRSNQFKFHIQAQWQYADNQQGLLPVEDSDSIYQWQSLSLSHSDASNSNYSSTEALIDRATWQHWVDTDESSIQIKIGRQAVGMGISPISSPIDIFQKIEYTALDREFRKGIDGIRILGGLGELGEWEASILGNPSTPFSVFRVKDQFDLHSVEGTLIHNELLDIVGGGYQGQIANLGIWFETTYNQLNDDTLTATSAQADQAVHTFRSVLGLDYGLTPDVIWIGEVSHNSHSDKIIDYAIRQITEAATRDDASLNDIYQLSQPFIRPSFSFFQQINWQFSPLTTLGIASQSTADKTELFPKHQLFTSFNYSLADETGLSLQLIWSDKVRSPYFATGDNRSWEFQFSLIHYF